MTLFAEARVTRDDAADLAARLLTHIGGSDFRPLCFPETGEVRYPWGQAVMTAEAGALLLRAEAQEERYLSTVKFLIVTRFEEIAREAAASVIWQGDGCDATTVPGFRELRLVKWNDVTPSVRRLTFSGSDLSVYDSGSMHVSLLFPPEGLAKPEWPRPGPDGRTIWPPDDRRPASRIYTIRPVDVEAGTLDIDFVRHGVGVASAFAEEPRKGALIGCAGPIGRKIPDVDFYLLASDETAIPAMSRILESAPATARGHAFIEVDNPGERQPLVNSSSIDVRWLYRDGAKAGTTTLLEDAAKAIDLPKDKSIFVWAAAETAVVRALRSHWRNDLALSTEQNLAVAYWKR